MLDWLILILVVGLVAERVWDHLHRVEYPHVLEAPDEFIEFEVPEPVVEYVRRPVPTPYDLDGFEGQAGLS